MNDEETEQGNEWESNGIRPAILGRRFLLQDDQLTYIALGLKERSNTVVLQAEATEEVRTIVMDEFRRLGTRIGE